MGQKWVTAADFWRLAPGEVWWLIDAYKAAQPKQAGINADDKEEMYAALMAAKASEKAA